MKPIVCCFLLALYASWVSTTDYCTKQCEDTQHIGCKNSGSWASRCPKDAAMVHLTAAHKNYIVQRHNDHRNHVASGKSGHLSAACRMATMKWSNELAYLASLNVKGCAMKHDGCHNTDEFSWSGQNLAWSGWFPPLNTTAQVSRSVAKWYKGIDFAVQWVIDKYPLNFNGLTIAHFTVMVNDRNTHVGCAASIYSERDHPFNAYLMACNYAQTNVIGVRVYSSCAKPASGCLTGKNPRYPSLCSPKEVYDVKSQL